MRRSYLYGYPAENGRDRYVHVRIQLPGRPHPSPLSFDSEQVGPCVCESMFAAKYGGTT